MKAQKIVLPDSGKESWLVLDEDFLPVQPICDYLNYLENVGRSPHTLRNSAIHLSEYWSYLKHHQLNWKTVTLSALSEFISWLRLPSPGIAPMYPIEARRTDQTINGYLATVSVFYEYHKMDGSQVSADLFTNRISPNKRYKSFLHHVTKGKPVRTRLVKLKVPRKLPKALEMDQVKQVLAACPSYRDKFLLGLLYQGGLRIGQALGLRHEDVCSMDNVIHIVPREDNANRARAKTFDQYSVSVPMELMTIYTRYLTDELGDIESDYVFVNLHAGQIARPMTYSTVYDLMLRVERKTGIRVRCHMLRHSHVTELFRAGIRGEIIQKRVGHKQLQTTTETYSHLNTEDIRSSSRAV